MEDKQKIPMYYEQIYDLMKKLNEAYSKRLGQIYFRVFRQLYSRVRFELSNERKEYYETQFKELSQYEALEVTEFKGYTYVAKELNLETKSNTLINLVFDLQLKLYQELENSDIFNYLKQNMELI